MKKPRWQIRLSGAVTVGGTEVTYKPETRAGAKLKSLLLKPEIRAR